MLDDSMGYQKVREGWLDGAGSELYDRVCRKTDEAIGSAPTELDELLGDLLEGFRREDLDQLNRKILQQGGVYRDRAVYSDGSGSEYTIPLPDMLSPYFNHTPKLKKAEKVFRRISRHAYMNFDEFKRYMRLSATKRIYDSESLRKQLYARLYGLPTALKVDGLSDERDILEEFVRGSRLFDGPDRQYVIASYEIDFYRESGLIEFSELWKKYNPR
ncbi:MAG: hypothetical protein QW292_09875 [Candidatus Parvarchaeota archaeon]